MENAAEALKMAGGVLIFVLALSISINAFTNTRQGIDNMVLYSDREFLTTYVEQNKGTKRIVGTDDMVPTIYRAYKENIRIEFANVPGSDVTPDENGCLYKIIDHNGLDIEYITFIDLENEIHGDENLKEFFLRKILFGDDVDTLYSNEGRSDDYEDYKGKISGNIVFNTKDGGLYKRLAKSLKTYEESLGVYFKGEENGTSDDSKVNKTEKKVITYSVF